MSEAVVYSALSEPRLDAWPRTHRVLPWLVAGLLFMIYLVPFDSITLPVHLPVDSDLDRFVLGAVFLVWLAVGVTAAPGRPVFRKSPINVTLLVFLTVALGSLGFNLSSLAWDGELTLSLKELSLLASYLALFYVCATTIRPDEVSAYAKLIVLLACLTAVGTIYQYDTGSNPFFTIAVHIFGAGHVNATAAAAISAASNTAVSTRPTITGPTVHGLADATIMSAAIPFALAFAASAKRRRESAIWLLIVCLLLCANVATGRKTGLLMPAASFLVLLAYEPRKYGRFLPVTLIAFVAIEVAAPSAISRLWYQISNASSSLSTQARVSDYGAVQPYILSHLLIGRGYGSFDPYKYRVLDDQMLDWLVEIGLIGAVSYLCIIVSAMATAHRAVRSALCDKRLMQAIVAFSAAFLVSNFTYDTFGFRQAPYIFFFMAALAVTQPTHPGHGPNQSQVPDERGERRAASGPPATEHGRHSTKIYT